MKNAKRFCCWSLLTLIVTVVVALPCWSRAEAKKLKIVTTTTDLASIAEAVAGEHAEITSLCTGKEDPHFLQAKPSYIVKARDADLWIRVGMELEIGWEPPILDGARNSAIRVGSQGHLDASERVIRLDVPTTRVTRAMGDVHPQGNPHYWLDPLNGRTVAKSIAERLKDLAPEHSEDFQRNLTQFQKALDERMFGKRLVEQLGGAQLWRLELKGELDPFLRKERLTDQLGGWIGSMKSFEGEKIVIYHQSWNYFVDRFGLIAAAELEPKPGVPPSATHLREVVEAVKAGGVKLILLEPFYSRKAADFVASKTGAKVVVCTNSVGGQPEATDYLALMDLVVKKVSNAL